MTQTTIVIGRILLNVDTIIATQKHINSHVDTNAKTELDGGLSHIVPGAALNGRERIGANIQSLDLEYILGTTGEINEMTGPIRLLRVGRLETSVLIEPIKALIEFSVASTIRTTIVNCCDGTNLVAKHVELEFIWQRIGTIRSRNEFFHEDFIWCRGEAVNFGHNGSKAHGDATE